VSLIKTQTAVEALEIAERLRRQGEYDWFRGQRRNWPLKSSFVRLEEKERNEALEKQGRFEQWVNSTRGLEDLAHHPDMVIAVAQHYGLPTSFIDFTTEPKIAAFFATDGRNKSGSTEGVIMCLNTQDLLEFWENMPERYDAPECLRLSVENLWRLEAQNGVFLFCPYGDFEEIYDLDRIVFPHTGELPTVSHEMIYPSRKSELEILLDQFFMNEQLITGTRNAMANLTNLRVLTLEPPGVFGDSDLLRESPPPLLDSWKDVVLKPWIAPDAETFHDSYTQFAMEIDDDRATTAAQLGDVTREKVTGLLSGTPSIRAKSLRFTLKSDERLSLPFLERLWDGLRRLPFTDDEIAAGMGNAMVLSDSRRRNPDRKGLDWDAEAEVCFGDVISVEFGPDDGSYARAFVNRQQLLSAVRVDIADYLNVAYKAQVLGNITGLLQAVFVPNRLFEYRKLAHLFATQLAPIQVLTRDDYAIYYSPARLTKFGLP
jgi:hypothetical protein